MTIGNTNVLEIRSYYTNAYGTGKLTTFTYQ